jgi:hypothetical protein
MIIFNLVGLAIVLGAFAVGAVVQGLATGHWGDEPGINLVFMGLLALAVDLLYRSFHSPEVTRWRYFNPVTGGQLVFIPVWLFGIVWTVGGVYALITGLGNQMAEHDRFVSGTATYLEDTVKELEKINTRAGWEAAQDRFKQCQQKLNELGLFYRGLDNDERRRLQQKYSARINRAAEEIRLQVTRLRLLQEQKAPEDDGPP